MPSQPVAKLWLSRLEVAALTGFQPVTITAYASKHKWRRRKDKGLVFFWHEDALKQKKGPGAIWNRPAHKEAEELRMRYEEAKAAPTTPPAVLIIVPMGIRAVEKMLNPVLSEGADRSRAPGAVRHITFVKE